MRTDHNFHSALTKWSVAFALSIACWALIAACTYAVAVSITGCATGHVYETGEMYCAAIGEDARVTYSSPQGDAGIIQSAPLKLIYCEGGPLVPSLLDGVGTVVKALFSWIIL